MSITLEKRLRVYSLSTNTKLLRRSFAMKGLLAAHSPSSRESTKNLTRRRASSSRRQEFIPSENLRLVQIWRWFRIMLDYNCAIVKTVNGKSPSRDSSRSTIINNLKGRGLCASSSYLLYSKHSISVLQEFSTQKLMRNLQRNYCRRALTVRERGKADGDWWETLSRFHHFIHCHRLFDLRFL